MRVDPNCHGPLPGNSRARFRPSRRRVKWVAFDSCRHRCSGVLSRVLRIGLVLVCRITLPTVKAPFGLKTQSLVNEFPLRCGVQFDALNSPFLEVLDAGADQCGGDSASSVIGIDQHHADPGEPVTITRRGHRADKPPVDFGNPAPVGFVLNQT